MSSTTGTWMIAVGALAAVIGLIMLPAALGEHPDTSLLVLGASCVSLGSMVAASGVYFKARALQGNGGSAAPGSLKIRCAGSAAVAMSVMEIYRSSTARFTKCTSVPTAWDSTTISAHALTFPVIAGMGLKLPRVWPRHAAPKSRHFEGLIAKVTRVKPTNMLSKSKPESGYFGALSPT